MQYIVAYPVVLLVRSFANQMFEGNTSVHRTDTRGLLKLTDIADPSNPSVLVRDALRDKHPQLNLCGGTTL